MNRRLLLFLVLCILGAIAWWLNQRAGNSTLDPQLTDFAVQDTSRVDRIFIADKEGRSIDLRRGRDGWVVNSTYKAQRDQVDNLLKAFKNVEVRSPVPKSHEAMVLRTMGAAAKRVEIYEGGAKPTKIWLVGHATKDHFGTYMVLEKPDVGRSSVPFVLGMSRFTGIINTRFHTRLDEWRNTSIYHYPDLHGIASLEVEHPQRPGASYRIENLDNGEPRLTDLKGRALPMDTVMVKGSLLPYRSLDYEYIERALRPRTRDSLLAATPNVIIRLTPRSGKPETMKLWYMPYVGEEPEFDQPRFLHDRVRMHALVQDTLLVVVQRQFVDLMTQPASALAP